ncbi:phage terminase small subunit P27 family [Paraburkholderia adhaesiva]|uniref:phage terminase small subunit P27 family n=1 Tax=Paraburkholderia adhaesiva TaxID=2883244 RepID=UPI001F2BDFCA|nr:phage terminase small subunit P27 family [Paraburkholderia adhaesiva]
MPRLRTPIPLRLIEGTLRAHHRRFAEGAKPKPKAPTPPEHVRADADALREWNRVVPELAVIGMLTALDRVPLAALCVCYSRWVQAERALARMAERDAVTRALMVKTVGGNVIQNPLVGVANKAMLAYARLCREFGMTPASRAGISTPLVDEDEPRNHDYF